MSLLVTVIILDLEDIFYFLLDSADVNTRCKRVVTTTTSSVLAPKTFLLIVLVFFWVGRESLLSGR